MFEKSGLIVLNKPTGMSSNAAVQIIKKTLLPQKIGHMGTLDPLGTGVLVIGINKATKLFEQFLKKDKTYRAIFYFGKETDTIDSEGKIVFANNVSVTYDDVKNVAKKFEGEFYQMPPMYSAKKILGKKAYEYARQGVSVKLQPRKVNIYSCKVLKQIKQNIFLFEINCSGGTYIRSLCRDIAKELSTYGTMLAIIRTKCGEYEIKDSCTLEDIKQGNFNFISTDK